MLLAHGEKDLNLKGLRWQTKEGKHVGDEGYRKEMECVVEQTKARVPVSLERSRLMRSSVQEPRPVLTLRTKHDGNQEAKCWCTLQEFKDLDALDLVRDRQTLSSTLSTNGSDDLAVDCFVSFCVDNRRREFSILVR